MFGKEKQIKPSPNSFINQMMEDDEFEEEDQNEEIDTEISIKQLNNQSETVIIIEKLSSALSPYFIVIVGLYLYEKSWLLSIILLTIGIISLLKISREKVDNFFTCLKQALGYEQNEEN